MIMKNLTKYLLLAAMLFSAATACRKSHDPILPGDDDEDPADNTELLGFYFVSEGQWGHNNATLDYYNLQTYTMLNNWWAEINPTVRGSLGDVANDIAVTDEFVLVTVNASNLLEISERGGRHVAAVEIPNCRMIACDGGYAYVTSYANDGYVAKVSLTGKQVEKTCATGHEPEGLAIVDGKLYVLNSCSYHTDFTGGGNNEIASISVIDLDTFTEVDRVFLGIINAYSPLTLMPDGKSFFINSSGDYNGVAPCSIIYDTRTSAVVKTFGFGGTYADVYDGKLYIFDTAFSYTTMDWVSSNCIYNPETDTVSSFPVPVSAFASFGAPSGVWINPKDGDIYIADKGNYTSPGSLYRFGKDGALISRIDTGVCPGHLAWDLR